jgi:hypothetical protein
MPICSHYFQDTTVILFDIKFLFYLSIYLIGADFTVVCLQASGDRYEATPIRARHDGLGALLLVLGGDVMVGTGFAAVGTGEVTKRTRPLQVDLEVATGYHHRTSEAK